MDGFEPRLPGDPELVRQLELAEALAFGDVYAALQAVPGNPTGASLARIGGAIAVGLTIVDVGLFNRVVGTGQARPATEADVEAISAFYTKLGAGTSVVQPAPAMVTEPLERWLAERGYRAGRQWVKMWHDLSGIEPPDAGHRIERIDSGAAEAFDDIVLQAFELPSELRTVASIGVGLAGWSHYLGYEGDTPVSVAAMRVDDGVAWLGYGATLEGFRGRGWQTAMFRRRLADARALGCRMAVTETGAETAEDPVNPSYRNMLRTGFGLAYLRRNYVRVVAPSG